MTTTRLGDRPPLQITSTESGQAPATVEPERAPAVTEQPAKDVFVAGNVPAPASAPRQDGVSPRGQQVLTDFMHTVEERTSMTAKDLFDPNVQRVEGAPLAKQIPEAEMKKLLGDTVKKMPLSDLPGGDLVARGVQAIPGADRIQGDVSKMSFDEISKQLPDAGKRMLEDKFRPMFDDFRKNHKEAFWGMAATGAVAAGAVAYTQGTKWLTNLGVKPELRQKFFDDRLRVGVGASWGPQFKDPAANLRIEGRTTDGRYSLAANADYANGGVRRVAVEGRADLSNQRPLGLDALSLTASYTRDFENGHDFSSFGIAGRKGSTVFSLNDSRDWQSGNSRTEAEIGARLWGGTLSGYAGHIEQNGHTDNQIGVIYRLRF